VSSPITSAKTLLKSCLSVFGRFGQLQCSSKLDPDCPSIFPICRPIALLLLSWLHLQFFSKSFLFIIHDQKIPVAIYESFPRIYIPSLQAHYFCVSFRFRARDSKQKKNSRTYLPIIANIASFVHRVIISILGLVAARRYVICLVRPPGGTTRSEG